MLDIALVGTGGMMPMPDRFLSSMILRLKGRMVLVDCGEGTQVSLKKIGWGFKAIDAIIFTHYHADHISGLVGMLLAIANSGREEKLTLAGPKGLRFVVEGILRIAQEIAYEIEYIEFDDDFSGKIDICGMEITPKAAVHSVRCFAYGFYVPRHGKFDAEKAKAFGIPKKLWSVLQKEGRLEFEGKTYFSHMVMGEERKGIKIAYCTDSRPFDGLRELAKEADIFVCEGMYGDDEKKPKAIENRHMLFSEAAEAAKRAKAKELWLTHFSPSLSKPEEFLEKAADIFPNTVIGFDGMRKTLLFEE